MEEYEYDLELTIDDDVAEIDIEEQEPETPKLQKPIPYVTNKDLIPAIEKWEAIGKDKPMPPELADMIFKIAKRYINHRNYRGYNKQLKEDMMSNGMLHCILYGKNINIEKYKNPFAYFTQLLKNGFIQVLNKEYNNEAKAVASFLSDIDNINNIDIQDTYNELLMNNLESNRKSKQAKKDKAKSSAQKETKAKLF